MNRALCWVYLMFTHLIHLLTRSFMGIPSSLGSTALGVLFPIFIALLGEAIGVKLFGWKEMIRNWRKATGVGFAAMAVGYTTLFVWLVIRNVYEDHIAMAQRIGSARQSSKDLHASLGMIVEGTGADGGLLEFVSVNLENGIGSERPLNGWNLEIVVDGKTIESMPFVLPGPGPEMSILVPTKGKAMIVDEKDYCPIVTENPLPSGASRSCWMMRIFDVDIKSVSKKDITAVVSFRDVFSGRNRKLETSIGPNYDDFPWTVRKR